MTLSSLTQLLKLDFHSMGLIDSLKIVNYSMKEHNYAMIIHILLKTFDIKIEFNICIKSFLKFYNKYSYLHMAVSIQ